MTPAPIAARSDRRCKRLLPAMICLIWGLFAVHNFLPYLGVRWESCQTMYSGLRTGRSGNNHLFLPQWSLSSVNTYYRVAALEIQPPPTASDPAELRSLGDAIKQLPDVVVNDEALRRIVHTACRAKRRVKLDSRTVEGDRIAVSLEDACGDPRFQPRRWFPVELYDPAVRMAVWHECQPPVSPEPLSLRQKGLHDAK
jgi:hypothetical protein